MWKVDGTSIQMTEGDYGVALPITVSGITASDGDCLSISIKKQIDGQSIISKYITLSAGESTFNFVLTLAESDSLSVRNYFYCLDWYHDGTFMCNLIPSGSFKVVNKA